MTTEPRVLRVWPLTVAHILILAFAVRFAVGLATDSFLYPDEVFQYLEQAHRLVFGPGIVPWEYEYGIRSWAVPLAIALLLQPLQLLGLDTPSIYQPVIKAALCAASLILPYSAYRVAGALSEAVARLALVLTAFWYELVSYGHRPTIDALATYIAFAALALLFSSNRPRVIAGSGALAGLTIVLRIQLVPMVAVMALVALWRWRVLAWQWAVAFCVVVVAGGALDYYSWGVWFSSTLTYVQLTVTYDVASQFGTRPDWWYVPLLVRLTGGLAIAGLIGLLWTARSSWPLIVMGAVTLAVFSVIDHKEARFIFSLIPLWLLGLAALAANRGELIARNVPSAAPIAPWLARGLLTGFVVISALGLFNALPSDTRVVPAHIARSDARQAYRTLADAEDLIAVLDLTGTVWWSLAPYYDLHRNVPLYWPAGDGFKTAQANPERYVSHVLTPESREAPAGFRRLTTVGEVAIWRRIADPPSTVPPTDYSTRLAGQPRIGRPTVNPRW
jgi:GPI mannosyltransferase 3